MWVDGGASRECYDKESAESYRVPWRSYLT